MSKNISLFSALVIGAIGPFVLHPGSAAAVPIAGDLDGDLTGGAADCAPLDPSVHPGAADRPDLDFVDSNCDGIDGNAGNAIFVSAVDGNDAGTGTRSNPLRTVGAGITAAASAGKDVYVAGGTYAGSLALADNVGVYGGYALGFLDRSEAETTTINSLSGPAALAVGDTGVVLQLLTLHGKRDPSDGNSYGIRAVPEVATGSQVVLEKVDVTAEDGGGALNGTTGSPGAVGAGGLGSAGGLGGCGAGVPGSLGVVVGGTGAPGSNGANGTFIAHAGTTWLRQQAPFGTSGADGAGGRGGQGGTGASDIFGIPVCGGSGGVGGRGGAGGSGGGGGFGGAGSFGVYAYNSSVVAVGSAVTGGNGGAGGHGGNGGNGGFGLSGLSGLPGACSSTFLGTTCAFPGSQGLTGLQGGFGGGGGGGIGGPSAAVYQGGPTSGFTQVNTALDFADTAAPGGAQGNSFIAGGQWTDRRHPPDDRGAHGIDVRLRR